jgi:chromosome segregation ATPase
MDEQMHGDFHALRDIQEIKLTLKYFTEDIVTQLTLLREAMAQSAEQKKEINKEVNNVEHLLKGFETKLNDYDEKFQCMLKKLEGLEQKLIDKNNPDALLLLLSDTKKTTQNIDVLLDEFKSLMLTAEDKSLIFNGLSDIRKSTDIIRDKKKNLMWWIDWIYKISITIVLVWNFIATSGA